MGVMINIAHIVDSNFNFIPRTKRFRCWSNDKNHYEMVISDNQLTICFDIPYRYKWIQIVDGLGNELCSNLFITDISLCELKSRIIGKFYFFLYVSDNGISYSCYIGGKQIVIEQDNNYSWHFLLPIYTIWNRTLLKNGELEYILSNTLLDNKHTFTKYAAKLTSNCTSIRDKVLLIHDFVASNLYYDYDALNSKKNTNRTIEQIVREKKCVCQGYADLTLSLLKSIGIEAENIICFAICDIFKIGWSERVNRISDLNHIITRAKLEKRWLYMDVTWDSNNRFENGEYIKGNGISHRYFDVTIPFLSSTHRFFKK